MTALARTLERSRETGGRIGDLLVRVALSRGPRPLDEDQLRSLGPVVASALFLPDEPMIATEDLEAVRPREWRVTWSAQTVESGVGTWAKRTRSWESEADAIAHARALERIGELTDEARHVSVDVRCPALPATDWEEVGR